MVWFWRGWEIWQATFGSLDDDRGRLDLMVFVATVAECWGITASTQAGTPYEMLATEGDAFANALVRFVLAAASW